MATTISGGGNSSNQATPSDFASAYGDNGNRSGGGGNMADTLRPRSARLGERIITAIIYGCGMVSILFVVLIFSFVLREAFPLLTKIPITQFFSGRIWRPTGEPAEFGFLPLLLSSVLVTLGAILIAVPLGLATALYIGEVASQRVREILKPLVEMLAAVPSVVLGFIGVSVLAIFLKNTFQLTELKTMLIGSIMLAFMSIPTIATISEDAIAAVPREIREGSLGLGATRWQTIRYVLFPAALSGIVAAIMIGIGRAIGETMVVLMVTGNGLSSDMVSLLNEPNNPLGWFQKVFASYLGICRTITATIADEMGEAATGGDHYRSLFLLGVVLFVITFFLNGIAWFALRKNRLKQ